MAQMDFPKTEEKILKFWKQNKVFEKSLGKRKKAKRFVFYEGPPTANAGPGFHHVLARVYKDIICRYKTMQGFLVVRKGGWDTHGLPVELQIEKKLGLKSKKDIEKYGIAKFNKECRKSVWEFKKEWEDLTDRIGYWLDMKDPYITYEPEYIESLWWIIKQFWDKGLLYKDYKVVPFCTRCGTPLSSHELAQGYETVKEPSVYVKFKVDQKELKKILDTKYKIQDTYLLAWTTTPWTLPGNVALAVHPDITYVLAEKNGEKYILAQAQAKEFKVLKKFKGKELEGLEYEPLYDSLKKEPEKKHYVALADFVSAEEGTGIVHTAVMYGEDDYQLGQKQNLPKRHTVDEEGKFNELVPKWKGVFVKDADPLIVEDLKKRNILLKEEMYEHEYPFCWRCETPLLYYAKETWFVNMQKVKKDLIKNNQDINWVPSYIKKGRFGEWLREVKDWAFSRERYWGTPLPIWECRECEHREVIGSLGDFKRQTFSQNTYYILRHGESEKQKLGIVVSWPEKRPIHLTKKGRQQVLQSVKKLQKKRIDFIYASDLTRTKETAEIVGKELGVKVQHEKLLREFDTGKFNGKKFEEFIQFFRKEGENSMEHYLERFTKRAPGGENWMDVQRRNHKLMHELEKKHKGKNILLVGHEAPFTLLESQLAGMSREEIVQFRIKGKIKTGELRMVSFADFPVDEDMQINLHRPYVDEVKFACPKCKGGPMERIKEVVDVWFDSGAMPFAQYHYPFENKKLIDGKGTLRPLDTARGKQAQGKQFPADYISEAIDQTRGWFYTLVAISTLLGKGTPYKNVISLGHILDEKGEKMSKSKGNIVDPWEMIAKYGTDAIRWYFFTASHPGDPKLFSEKDLQQATRSFLLPLWNSYVFYEMYGMKNKGQKLKSKSNNILDKWILSRLTTVTEDVTARIDMYDVTGAARALEYFVVQDLSLWYIRRSRARFQNPQTKTELQEASTTLGYVLLEASKLAAPFVPFIAEHIYKEFQGSKISSVHLEDWTKVEKRNMNKKLEESMEIVREIVAKGLAARAKVGIRVRQPLASLKFSSPNFQFSKDFLELIKDELNVKEVVFAKAMKKDVELDTRITGALRREGMTREILRHIQDMRKKAGYQPKHRIRLRYSGNKELEEIIKQDVDSIKKSVGIKELIMGDKPKQVFDVEQEFEIEGHKLWLGIRKI